jgi:hypothetical protein
MQTARWINMALWSYVMFSGVLQPVTVPNGSDYWTEFLRQALSLNHNIFDNPPRFLGNIIVPLVLWFGCDVILRWLYSWNGEEKK